jgi:hypothetical protein
VGEGLSLTLHEANVAMRFARRLMNEYFRGDEPKFKFAISPAALMTLVRARPLPSSSSFEGLVDLLTGILDQNLRLFQRWLC